tara:strand:- start:3415 stop:3861 length:447 start_codon:yes stop_codon:yes gene_type:complete
MSSKFEDVAYHERICFTRTHLGLSQAEMAGQVGIPLRTYQNYERGEREASLTLVRALHDIFNVSPLWLLCNKGEMFVVTEPYQRFDNMLLQQVVEAVEKFTTGLPQSISTDHKARLITLLYEKSLILSEVAGERLSPIKLEKILKLVA